MNDERLQSLLNQADERFGHAAAPTSDHGQVLFVEQVRTRRARQVRRRTTLGVLAVLLLVGSFSASSWSAGLWTGRFDLLDTIASNVANRPDDAELVTTTDGPASTTGDATSRRLRPDEVKRIRAEIAALNAEADRARRLVDLYRGAEARRERLAALEAAPAEPLLPPEALAALAIDRAAAITVTSADAQAKQFNRPAEAAESYRSVLTHFPSSRWASVARQRLEAMQHMN
jgi:hypothetical protein